MVGFSWLNIFFEIDTEQRVPVKSWKKDENAHINLECTYMYLYFTVYQLSDHCSYVRCQRGICVPLCWQAKVQVPSPSPGVTKVREWMPNKKWHKYWLLKGTLSGSVFPEYYFRNKINFCLMTFIGWNFLGRFWELLAGEIEGRWLIRSELILHAHNVKCCDLFI